MTIQKFLVALVCLPHGDAQSDRGSDDDTATVNYYVSRSEDDAEEGTNGQVHLTNEDLDQGQLSGFESPAAVGIRFERIRILKGHKIKRAFVQFTTEGNRTKVDPTE